MENILILYYLISLAFGIFCLGSLFAILNNNKNDFIQSFFVCYGLFCLFILTTTLQAYIRMQFIQLSTILFLLLFAIQFFSIFYSLLILTILINKIHLVPFANNANKVLSLFTTFIWLFCILREANISSFFSLSILRFIDDELLYFIICLYIIYIYIFYKKNVKNSKLYQILRKTFFIVLLYVPGFVMDELLSSETKRLLIFTPFFFMIISTFSIYSFFRYHNATQIEKYNINDDLKSKMGISDREVEVAQLLLKGYSYQKIADELIISISTVRTHVTNIYKKSGVKSRYELYHAFHSKGPK